jgi:hypothetical protein
VSGQLNSMQADTEAAWKILLTCPSHVEAGSPDGIVILGAQATPDTIADG